MNGGVSTSSVGLGLAAALLLGLGFVLQQRMARLLPHSDALSPRLFLDLIGKPLWLAGIGAMVGGQLLGAAALGAGDVSLVEPLLTTNLLFALLIARFLSDLPLGPREWIGGFGLVAGVVVFLVCADPRPARAAVGQTGTSPGSAAFLTVVAVAVAVLVALARNRKGTPRASMLAVGAGLLFGLQDGLTRGAMNSLDGGLVSLLRSWSAYMVVVAAIIGILLMQSAFEAAPLRASLPVITAAEPLTGIAFGIGVYGERVRLSPEWVVGQAIGLAVMILGVVLVARGHTLASHHHRRHRRRQS